MAEEKLTAATRLEKILDNIAGGVNDITPATRLEKFLSYIADAMGGGITSLNSVTVGIKPKRNITVQSNTIYFYLDNSNSDLYDYFEERILSSTEKNNIFGSDIMIPVILSGDTEQSSIINFTSNGPGMWYANVLNMSNSDETFSTQNTYFSVKIYYSNERQEL